MDPPESQAGPVVSLSLPATSSILALKSCRLLFFQTFKPQKIAEGPDILLNDHDHVPKEVYIYVYTYVYTWTWD